MSNFLFNPGSESSPRLRASLAREQDRLEKRLSAYQREFKTRASSIAARQKRLQDSLLAHSIRLRSTTKQGTVGEYHDRGGSESHELMVRAKPIRRSRGTGERRTLTLQELLNRGPNTRVEPMAHPPEPPILALPQTDHPRASRNTREDCVKLNLVSASDLNDLRDFPDFGKFSPDPPPKPPSPEERQHLTDESSTSPRKLRPFRDKSDIYQQLTENMTKDIYVFLSDDNDENNSDSTMAHRELKPLNNFRKRRISLRNSLTKRMKLPSTSLELIPEDDPAEEGSPDMEVSGKQVDFMVSSASRGRSRIRGNALEPLGSYTVRNMIGQHDVSRNPVRTAHRKRENDKKVGSEIDVVVPRKKSYKPSDDNDKNNTRLIARDEAKPTSGDVSERVRYKGHNSTSKTGYRRLVFLQDSPGGSQ